MKKDEGTSAFWRPSKFRGLKQPLPARGQGWPCRKKSEQGEMSDQETVKQLEDCSVFNALGTWFFSVAGALVAIPIGIKRKSLGPLVFFGITGSMLDIMFAIRDCEREHAERQMALLEGQNSATGASPSEMEP